MVNEQCDGCRFWKSFDIADERESPYEDDLIGNCHRYPPVRVVMADKDEDSKHSYEWSQPITTSRDWCGEYQPCNANPNTNTKPLPSIDSLGLPDYIVYALANVGITTIEQLIEKPSRWLMSIPNLGSKRVNRIKEAIQGAGLTFPLVYADIKSTT